MADLHHQHGTVVEERDGMGSALMVLLAVAVIGFLIWLFAFSGVFGGGDDTDVNITNDRTEQTDGGGGGGTTTDDGTTTDGGTGGTETDTETQTSP